MANAILEGSFKEQGVSQSVGLAGKANITISNGMGLIHVEKSFDNENFFPMTAAPFRVSENTPLNGAIEEHESAVYYRFNCVEYTGGEIYYRIGKPSILR